MYFYCDCRNNRKIQYSNYNTILIKLIYEIKYKTYRISTYLQFELFNMLKSIANTGEGKR